MSSLAAVLLETHDAHHVVTILKAGTLTYLGKWQHSLWTRFATLECACHEQIVLYLMHQYPVWTQTIYATQLKTGDTFGEQTEAFSLLPRQGKPTNGVYNLTAILPKTAAVFNPL